MPCFFAWFALICTTAFLDAAPIRVVVWDEQQPAQKPAYTNFLGNAIAAHLRTQPGLTVTSVNFDDPEQGLSQAVLDACEVLIWWGHVKNGQIQPEKARSIVKRIQSGQLSLIALHSAHWAEPFVQAMRERAISDALNSIPGLKLSDLELVTPERFRVPKTTEPLTPRLEETGTRDGRKTYRLTLPNCVFPHYRADGAPSHVTTLIPSHPIAKGIPTHFDIPQTEMYNDPFHVPKPDLVLFQENWDKGESFRSGAIWNVGKGKVFYFRPGHETYPIYTQPIPLRILANAVQWLGSK